MEKLLLIAIPDTDGVEQVARRLRLRTVLVQPEQYARSLGQLAGYPAAAAEETPALPLPETGLLVMCGLKNSHMDKLLAALRPSTALLRPYPPPRGRRPLPMPPKAVRRVSADGAVCRSDPKW